MERFKCIALLLLIVWTCHKGNYVLHLRFWLYYHWQNRVTNYSRQENFPNQSVCCRICSTSCFICFSCDVYYISLCIKVNQFSKLDGNIQMTRIPYLFAVWLFPYWNDTLLEESRTLSNLNVQMKWQIWVVVLYPVWDWASKKIVCIPYAIPIYLRLRFGRVVKFDTIWQSDSNVICFFAGLSRVQIIFGSNYLHNA